MRTFVLFLSALPVFLPSVISAQQPLNLESGARVQVTAPDCGVDEQAGLFQGLQGDTVVLTFGAKTVRCRRTSVTRFERSLGLKSQAWQGALFLGAIAALVGATTYQECESDGWMDCFLAAESAGDAAARFGLVGAGLGALFGAATKTERWEEVPLDRLRVSVVPKKDGRFALGLRIAF